MRTLAPSKQVGAKVIQCSFLPSDRTNFKWRFFSNCSMFSSSHFIQHADEESSQNARHADDECARHSPYERVPAPKLLLPVSRQVVSNKYRIVCLVVRENGSWFRVVVTRCERTQSNRHAQRNDPRRHRRPRHHFLVQFRVRCIICRGRRD